MEVAFAQREGSDPPAAEAIREVSSSRAKESATTYGRKAPSEAPFLLQRTDAHADVPPRSPPRTHPPRRPSKKTGPKKM